MSIAQPISTLEAEPLAPPTNLRRDFIMPMAMIGMLVLLARTVGVHFGVQALNEESAAREQQLVHNGLALRQEEVASLVVPQVDWDDAVRNLDNHFSAAWATSNIHEFLEHAYGFDGEFVLDADDRPVFAALGRDVVAPGAFDRLSGAARGLVRSVRQQEIARGPIAPKGSPDLISRSIQASAAKVIDGQLTIVTATLVQPDFGTALPAGPRAPIVVTLMHVDKPFLAQFSRRFLLNDVRVRLPSQAPIEGRIEVPVNDERGAMQAVLTWKALDPGYGLLRRMGLPVLQGLLVIMAIAALELRWILTSARRLIARERFAYEFAFDDHLADVGPSPPSPFRPTGLCVGESSSFSGPSCCRRRHWDGAAGDSTGSLVWLTGRHEHHAFARLGGFPEGVRRCAQGCEKLARRRRVRTRASRLPGARDALHTYMASGWMLSHGVRESA